MRQFYTRDPAGRTTEAAAAWRRIAAQLEPTTTAAPWRIRRPWSAMWAAAAALVLVVGAGALATRGAWKHDASVSAVGMRQIATAKGQRAEVQLDDGSRIMLGVASRLRVVGRNAYLQGTAYFDVVHDATRPFVVHTANAVTEDIGTRFVVTSYPETESTQVVVAEGMVGLGASNASADHRVRLGAGHLGRLRGDGPPSVQAVDPSLYTAWTQGELVFRDTPLSDVVAELRRWYDVDVRLGDPSLHDRPLTASFVAESFDDALAVVTTVLPVRAVRRGTMVTLYAR